MLNRTFSQGVLKRLGVALAILFALACLCPAETASQAVVYRKAKVAGSYCHVVEIDLQNPEVCLKVVRSKDLHKPKRYTTFGSFVVQTRPLAAITGTFFDTATGNIICNLVQDGKLLESGSVGHTLSLTQENTPNWLITAGKYGGGQNWKDCEFAVSSGPTLVRAGRVALNPWSEGFSDPGLFRQAARTGLGTTKDGKLLMVSVNQGVTLGRFARMMKALGCQDALNLDGGSSTALYARGRYLSKPRRKLTNVLMVMVRAKDPIPKRLHLEGEALEVSTPFEEDEPIGPAPEPAQVDLETLEIWL